MPRNLDKVKELMTNLEEVVREKNKANHELETGEHKANVREDLTTIN